MLSEQEETFCRHYFEHRNGAAAFAAAWPDRASARRSRRASEQARRLRKRPAIARRLAELRGDPVPPPPAPRNRDAVVDLRDLARTVGDTSLAEPVRAIALNLLIRGLDSIAAELESQGGAPPEVRVRVVAGRRRSRETLES